MKNPLTKHLILITVLLMDLLAGMEFDLFVPSFPQLQAHFQLSASWIEALLSLNFIGYCIGLFIAGELGDRYGRKPIILAGFFVFIIGSVCCVFGQAYSFLLVGRFLQGLGIASPAILSFLIIADLYPLKKQQSLMALLNGVNNISFGLAPVLGSHIALYFHWRGNFMTLLLLGLIGFLLTLLFIPTQKALAPHKKFSLQAYVTLLQYKPLLILIINIILMFLPYWIFVGIAPLLYMENLGVPLAHFGYYQGALAMVFAFGSIAFSLVLHRYESKKMLWFSNQVTILSLLFLLALTVMNSHNPLFITITLILFTASQVVPSNLLYPLCINLKPEAKGRVSAIIHITRLSLTALCLQVVAYFYDGSFRNVGMILCVSVGLAILSLVAVLRSNELNNFNSAQ